MGGRPWEGRIGRQSWKIFLIIWVIRGLMEKKNLDFELHISSLILNLQSVSFLLYFVCKRKPFQNSSISPSLFILDSQLWRWETKTKKKFYADDEYLDVRSNSHTPGKVKQKQWEEGIRPKSASHQGTNLLRADNWESLVKNRCGWKKKRIDVDER